MWEGQWQWSHHGTAATLAALWLLMALADHLHRAKDCVSPPDADAAKPRVNSSLHSQILPCKAVREGRDPPQLSAENLSCFAAEQNTKLPRNGNGCALGSCGFLAFSNWLFGKEQCKLDLMILKGLFQPQQFYDSKYASLGLSLHAGFSCSSKIKCVSL